MLALPILNVRLQACSEEWSRITPLAQGHHCATCDRVVVDFTNSTAADLEAAHADSPDGRLCGRFRPEQLVPKPALRPKLRRFLVALVLVCGLGLTSREAWAQVRAGATCVPSPELLLKTPEDFNPVVLAHEAEPVLPPLGPLPERSLVLGMMMEQMPVYKHGGSEGLMSYIQKNLKYPAKAKSYGKVFISFVVTKTGPVKKVQVMKGLEPLLDAEAVRAIKRMGPWEPGKQVNRAIDVSYTIPVAFRRS